MSDERKPFSGPKGPKGPRGGKPDGREKRPAKPAFGGKPGRFSGKDAVSRREGGKAEPRAEGFKKDFGKPARDPRPPRTASDRKGSGSRAPSFGGKPFQSRAAEDEKEPGERIAKRLARAGISSRRDAEELIAAGRIKVNGKALASPAFNVRHGDVIELDGTEIPAIERTRLFLFHKPAGVVTTTRDPQGRKTVFDILPKDLPRLMTIGRLDINTEGLLLLTNDGGLSRVLELPSTGWLRRYRVRVHGKVDTKALEGLKDGIAVDGVFYGAIEAALDREQGSNAWLTIGLREGKNREVKNVLGSLGLEVSRLIRVSYGPFQLGELAEGAVQELKGRTLRDQLGQRLVDESGANFSAAIATPFSNSPVRPDRDAAPEAAERPVIRRDGERGRIGEGGLVKNRKREREEKRENALGRLQTTRPERPRGFKPEGGGKGGAREKKREEPPRSRSTNVWMAPGARPGERKPAAESTKSAKPPQRGKDAGQRRPDARPPRPGPGKGPRNR